MDHISPARNGGEKPIKIVRGKVSEMRLYEVKEHELDMLEKGMSANLFLTIGLALVSIACSFLIALLTIHNASERIFMAFTIIVGIGSIVGFVLIFLSCRHRQSTAALINEIRSRILDEETQPIEREGEEK